MKGKGKLRTYWLESRAANKLVNKSGLRKLDEEVQKLLENTNFDTQKPKKTALLANAEERSPGPTPHSNPVETGPVASSTSVTRAQREISKPKPMPKLVASQRNEPKHAPRVRTVVQPPATRSSPGHCKYFI